MMTPIHITQTLEKDSVSLSDTIHDPKLKSPTSTLTTTPLSDIHVSSAANFAATMIPYINTGLAFSTTNYSPEAIGSTSLSTTGGIISWNHSTAPFPEEWDCYCAQHYYETMCHKTPQYLLAMAYG